MKHHPAEEVKQLVLKWDRFITTFPTWEELIEVEFVRLNENVNMFSDDIKQRCTELGLLHAINWLERLSRTNVPTQLFRRAMMFYEKKHGPASEWPMPDVKHVSNV